jgi:DNA polymerase III delta prime subunit
MIDSRDEMFLWVEKYRPQKIDDCVLPQALKDTFRQYVEQGELPNFLFTGSAGVGKTTIAKALCNEIGAEYMMINGSEESGIDTLRTKIKGFASTISLTDAKKVVILDEADYLNANSTQPALRGFIEEFANNCRFILTCNFKNRIIEPLHSRCGLYEFNTTKKDLVQLAAQFMKRAEYILAQEGVDYGRKDIADLIMKHAPDWRRVLNELQRRSSTGETSSKESGNNYDDLFASLKTKDFKKMRSWVVNNQDVDTATVFRNVYDRMQNYAKPQSIPQLVLILADYQYKDAFVADHELNMVACMTEIMSAVDFQ